MALIDVERAVLSVCFAAEPPEASLKQLGEHERERWLLYRELTRDRLWHELQVALPRTCAAVGEAVLARAFVTHLDRDPPRTRYFREIVLSFAVSARRRWQAGSETPPFAIDLLRYEAALWEVSDLEAGAAPDAREFAFDRVPLLTPALRLLELEHAVHTPGEQSEPARGQFYVAVQREADEARPRTWSFNQTTYALLEDFLRGEVTAAESVQRIAARLGRQVTPQFVERLCESLAQWIEVGILVGSR